MFSMSLLGMDEEEVGEDEMIVSCTLLPLAIRQKWEWSSSLEKLLKRRGEDDSYAMATVAMYYFFGSSSSSLESHC
jgi:hypothetical protein